jgi:phospholipid-translocating ATPase
MFLSPHARSFSEANLARDYEPALTSSPGSGAASPAGPVMAEEMEDEDAQYATRPYGHGVGNLNSPHPSFYSASDIPAPSPMPEPVYRFSNTGELTSTPPSRRPSMRTVNSGGDPNFSPSPTSSSLQVPTRRPSNRQPIVNGNYEMRVRSPPRYNRPLQSPLGSETPLSPRQNNLERSGSEVSHASVATASEGYMSDGSPSPPRLRASPPAQAEVEPSAPTHHLTVQGPDEDHARRVSQISTYSQTSWSGPHAV